MLSKFYNKKNINILAYLFLFFSFILVFYFSFKTVLHHHSYSQIFINYSEGFVKNAFLGEIIFTLKSFTNLDFKLIINFIFLIFHSLNIFLFLKIIRPVLDYNKIIYIFLLLNPALILFSIYDIGAFLRKEVIIITAFLFHIYISQLYNCALLDKKKYNKYTIYILIPFIFVNSLIHSIQILFLPVHFFIFKKNFNKEYDKKDLFFIFVLLLLFISQFFLYQLVPGHNLYEATIKRLGNFSNELNISEAPYLFLTLGITERFYANLPFLKDLNFLTLYIISAFIIFVPLIFMLKKINTFDNKFNLVFTLLSIFPFVLLMFLASDWGRWIYIIAMIILGIKLQFKIKSINNFDYSILIKVLLFSIIGFYIFFYNLSHCCIKNLFFYGMNQNFQLLGNIIFDNLNIIKHIKY